MQQILQAIQSKGGCPLFVGGCVRDQMMGIAPKDFDVEVYQMSPRDLIETLQQFGRVDVVGESFGVIKLSTEAADYDFSLPRRESKNGNGHRGFIVNVDPTMTPKEAASRRDFTINSLAQDPFSGMVYDFFGGVKDIENKILRATSEKFVEDPLRVLRGMQFSGRFDLWATEETTRVCKLLKSDYQTLPVERVWAEFQKWAAKSIKPSKGLHFLLRTGWIEHFTGILNLVGLPQDREWHPEGNVFRHTCFVVDAAAQIAIREDLNEGDRTALMLSALCHDFGKAVTTELVDGRWISPGHDRAGVEITEDFLYQIGAPIGLTQRVVEMVREHMIHVNEVTPRSVRRLLSRLQRASISDILFLIEADHSGRPPLPGGLPESARMIGNLASGMGNEVRPLLMGRHLLGMGYQPGPEMGLILRQAFEAQLEGEFSDLDGAVGWVALKEVTC